MHHARPSFAAGLLAAGLLSALSTATTHAAAQLEPLDEGLSVGAWTFYPSVELRLRGEYRRNPVDVGGDVYEGTAVQLDGYQSSVPAVLRRDPEVSDQWLVSERARLGLRVEWDVLTGNVVLQDARVLGIVPGAADSVDDGSLGSFGPYEAYLDVRTDVEDPLLQVRVGRQSVVWGDGRLIGGNDWQLRGGSFDAARLHLRVSSVEVQALAAMLSFPGPVSPTEASHERQTATDEAGAPANAEGTGVQLYGLDVVWRIVELFGAQVTGLARIAREPLPPQLARGDTYVVDGRVFGDYRGVSYAVEAAYQLGRVAGFGILRDVRAFAGAARVSWQTALPADFRFAAHGAYASGDDSGGQGEELTRFDPIAPEVHDHHGMMDLYGWSNVIDAGGLVSARPVEELLLEAGYNFVGLAEPTDRWSTGELVVVGVDPDNQSRILGHEVDVRLVVEPWPYLSFMGGYGAFILGDGGKAILDAAGRGDADLLHYGFVQAELSAP